MSVGHTIVIASSMSLALAMGYLGDRIQSALAQDATSAITDKFATTVLRGGCSIRLAATGRTVTTEGSGGACPTTVKAMVDRLEALNPSGLRVFVVSEDEDQPSGEKNYRFVVTFKGQSDTQDADIFLSVLGTPQRFANTFMEAMGFDSASKAYVYYHLVAGKWEQAGSGATVPLDTVPGREDAMACQRCHSTGAPLMRELHDSWANWHSSWDGFKAPNITDPLFGVFFNRKIRADILEPIIIAGTKASAVGRVDRAVAAKRTGLILKQAMCEVGEPNLVGVHQRSGVRFGDIVTQSSMLPSAILLNQVFAAPIAGTGRPFPGFEGNLQMNLPDLGQARSVGAAYVAAARKLGISIGGMAGLNDAKFAWFGPEKSYADLAVVMELLARNLVDKDVLADAMMVDFTTPMFSKSRCELADTIPANFANSDELRTAWIANLVGSTVRGAAGLKGRLEKKGDFADHEKTLNDYLKACAARSTAAPEKFNEDVLTIVAQRRNEFRHHYEKVLETNMILPTDNASATTEPGTWRLSAATCDLEEQTAMFQGE